jgi:hypothetical protein
MKQGGNLMARERLTSRARQAADDKTPYPGSMNQEGREEEQRGSNTYRTFEPSVANHELQDLRKVHGVSDQHNEIGFGIPDPASGMLVASSEYQAKCIKAAELAETYLGPKVGDRMLLAQARDFLSLTDEVLDRSLERFNRTDSMYVAEEVEEAEETEVEETEVEETEEAEVEEAPVVEAPVAETSDEPEGNTSRDIPAMEEGSAASPTVADAGTGSMDAEATASPAEETAAPDEAVVPQPEMAVEEAEAACMMSEARATNLTNLAAATLQPHDCTQENIVATAKKFASLEDDQIKTLLAGYGKEFIAGDDCDEDDATEAGSCASEEAPEEAPVEEKVAGEIEVAQSQGIDIGSFDLSEEFNDGPIVATEEETAELSSIFEGVEPVAPQNTAEQSMIASIAQLSGSKTASKLGVKSIGRASLQGGAQPAQGVELESLWESPSDFPGGGF